MPFVHLNQGFRNWTGLAADNLGNIYCGTVVYTTGDIFKRTLGTGNFVAEGLTVPQGQGYGPIAYDPFHNDMYATAGAYGGGGNDIWYQHNLTGDFVNLSVGVRDWEGVCVDPTTGDVYAVAQNNNFLNTGGIYVQRFGQSPGTFSLLQGPYNAWFGCCAAPNGDIYVVESSYPTSYVYKQAANTSGFVQIPQPLPCPMISMCSSPSGDIYVGNQNGDIYKMIGGVGSFVAQGVTGNWAGMTSTPNGDVYASSYGADIYFQAAPPSVPTLIYPANGATNVYA